MASEKITAIIEELKGLTVLELSELVHAVEDEFGVSAAAPVVVAGGARTSALSPCTKPHACIYLCWCPCADLCGRQRRCTRARGADAFGTAFGRGAAIQLDGCLCDVACR